jgi:hypothetical protein
MGNVFLPSAVLYFESRRKTVYQKYMTRERPLVGDYDEQKGREREFPNAKRRHVGPCNTYNCHGLTFGARRAAITSGISEILIEDDYAQIDTKDVLPGDIAVYYSTGTEIGSVRGDIEHSGIVIKRTESSVKKPV